MPAVVALRVSATRSFDSNRAGVALATGFVVDAERGLILTNRHVVTTGPVTAEAVFLNHERVAVLPVYRDPVHDFGFYRFDPAAVRFMEPGEIALAPEGARVGAEIRVVGNDAGEKLSILAGTLARLDRPAPDYGRRGYNDFNTFYYQAASGTSGGSSGSPVLDRSGRAVALNAGAARRSSSSFFLPLERVVHALEAIRRDAPVPRGTLQVVFAHHSFDELQRLGLRAGTEARVRRERPRATGMLVVDEVVPGGPAEGLLSPGDVVVGLEGALPDDFVGLEGLLDGRVGGVVAVDVERGGEPLRVEVPVADLHAVTPAAFLEFGGGILQRLPYQQARNHGIPARGVMLGTPGYAFGRAGVPGGSLLEEIGGQPVADLASAETLLSALPDGARVPVRFFRIDEPRAPRVAVVSVDRRWFPMRRCQRDDAAGTWPCRASAPPPDAAAAPAPATVDLSFAGPRAARRMAASLVFVEFDVPFRIDGAHGAGFSGAGLVVDAERGLVVVDRDTVPVSLGDVSLTFGRSLRVPGRVVALHPEHDLAVVSYDPRLLGETAVRSARLCDEPLEPGDGVWLVGLDPRQSPVVRHAEVAAVEEVPLPLPSPPRFRTANTELVLLAEQPGTVGGVLADGRGRVRALWASISRDDRGSPDAFFAGIPADIVLDMVTPLREGRPFERRSLGVELAALPLSEARELGLPEDAARALAEHDPERRRVLQVERLLAGSPAASVLEVGDLLVRVDGEPVTDYREAERAARAPRVALEVVRDGTPLALRIATVTLDPIGTRRALLWGGALLQPVPLAARLQRGVSADGVYVAARAAGSPAERHGLLNTRRIVAANGLATPDLDAFLAAVAGTPDRGSVRLRVEDLDGRPQVLTLEVDLVSWPPHELRFEEGRWRRVALAPEGEGLPEAAESLD